ncbi:MAG: excinuclease ABC subunit A, partial [Ignavibacteria bacterium]
MSKASPHKKHITISHARVNNLKDISCEIPRNALTVISGVSGSGKSSLAFETLYAEGQRRFVESLSSYARQFLDRMNKPDVESITGLPPAIAIEQRGFARNPRSTVATQTEIYDYLRLLYGRIGTTICTCGREVRKDTPAHAASVISEWNEGDRLYILFP